MGSTYMQMQFHAFGEYRLYPGSRSLWRGSAFVPLTGREFDTLWTLVQRAGRPVDKETFRQMVWPGVEVADVNLRKQIESVRKKLGRDPAGRDYIETIRNQGYFFAASVAVGTENAPAAVGFEPETRPPVAPEQLSEERLGPANPAVDPLCLAPKAPKAPHRFRLPVLVGSGALLAVLVIGFLLRGMFISVPIPPVRPGRLLARSTSEGRNPDRIKLSHGIDRLAISPQGDKLFAGDARLRILSIVTTKGRSVRTIHLPRDPGSFAVSPEGLLYIGSQVEGIMVFDIDKEQLRPDIIPTGGPVWSMALTPDGAKLFLAMGQNGLKRLLPRTGRLDQISKAVCPQHLAMGRQGKTLVVAYQCTSPGGDPKHDLVEIFDADKETSLGIISDPPMVGGPTAISPDGKLILQDGWDACFEPLEGCKEVPSVIFHLFRSSDLRRLKTLNRPVRTGVDRFLDNSRFVLSGPSISVIDAAKYSLLEQWGDPADELRTAVFPPDGRVAYFSGQLSNSILVFDVDPAECAPPRQGLSLFYSGDGSADDGVGQAHLTAQRDVQFRPGRVGQAFYLDGGNSLLAPWTDRFAFGFEDFTLALYLKAADFDGEMVLVDRVNENPRRGVRLLRSAEGRLAFQSWPYGGQIASRTSLKRGTWYHVAVTKTNQELTLYVNGEPEGAGAPPEPYVEPATTPLFLGASHSGHPSFRGLLDEIAFYDRALSAEEIKEMYLSREVGPCQTGPTRGAQRGSILYTAPEASNH